MAKKQAAIYIVTLVFELVLVLAGDGIILLSKNTIAQPHGKQVVRVTFITDTINGMPFQVHILYNI
jgi:hypothetical protein